MIFWALVVAIQISSFFYDLQVLDLFLAIRTPILTAVFRILTGLGSFIFIPALVLSAYYWKRKIRQILPLWASLVGAFAASWVIKEIFQRPRPVLYAMIQETGYAFPSSHATVAFALLPFLSMEFPKWKAAWWFLALGIAASRAYLGVHYMSDIIAGALLGYAAGVFFLTPKVQKALEKIFPKVTWKQA